jgi:hypothetical protein
LVFKNNQYVGLLNGGKHWIKSKETLTIFDMSKPLVLSNPDMLNILGLQDVLLKVDVADNEIVLQFGNGLFKTVLQKPISAREVIDRTILAKPVVLSYIRTYTVEI